MILNSGEEKSKKPEGEEGRTLVHREKDSKVIDLSEDYMLSTYKSCRSSNQSTRLINPEVLLL